MKNGYYQDTEIRTYKVTDDQIFLYNEKKFIFEPLLEYQAFIVQYKNNLLINKNIIELHAPSGSVFLMYRNCDSPDDSRENEICESPLPFTPEKELEQLKKEIFDLKNEIWNLENEISNQQQILSEKEDILYDLVNKKMCLDRELS